MRRALFLFLAMGGWGVAQGCGGADNPALGDGSSDDGTVSDGPTSNDSGGPDVGQQSDGSSTDSGTGGDATSADGGSTDGGVTDSGTSTLLRCGDASVNDCTQCQGATQPCVYCNALDASVLTGVCTTIHTSCFNVGIPTGFQDCPCQNASTCPEGYQVCTNTGRCHTCSDTASNNGLKCENNGTCDYVDGGCP